MYGVSIARRAHRGHGAVDDAHEDGAHHQAQQEPDAHHQRRVGTVHHRRPRVEVAEQAHHHRRREARQHERVGDELVVDDGREAPPLEEVHRAPPRLHQRAPVQRHVDHGVAVEVRRDPTTYTQTHTQGQIQVLRQALDLVITRWVGRYGSTARLTGQ
jgi:hypothetical protein